MDAHDGYVIFDLETTGLAPGRHDRIIEIGIVRLDNDFDVIEEWETLINPDRDIGPTQIHGIRSQDVANAPKFEDVAVDIWHRFEGAIPVAHNLAFDRRFLLAEFRKIGISIGDLRGICTINLCSQFRLPCRSLVDVCQHLSIIVERHHSAGMDAQLCSQVFQKLWPQTIPSSEDLRPATCQELSRRAGSLHGVTRAAARERHVNSPLEIVAKRLSAGGFDEPEADENALSQYLLVLDRVLEDRQVDEAEAVQLSLLAVDCGIRREQVVSIHNKYIQRLAAAIVDDGVVTDSEKNDIHRVAHLLHVDEAFVEAALQPMCITRLPTEDLSGHTVCFSGESQCLIEGVRVDKAQAESLVEQAGLTPLPRVTKRLDILVLCDPDSMSSKAKKARKYGVRIIAERPFWRKIGVHVG
jgi:DNA polymerase-3 subunit epsilon